MTVELDDEIRSAIDKIEDRRITDLDATNVDNHCVPCGIPQLDQEFRGFPKGSVIALEIDPRGIGEYFAYHLSAVLPTKYISTVRDERQIRESFESLDAIGRVPEHVDIIDFARDSSNINNHFSQHDNAQNFVIDTFGTLVKRLNKEPESTVNTIKTQMREKEGIAYLLITEPEKMEEVYHICDSVFTIERSERGRESMQQTVKITKVRGNDELGEQRLPLEYQGGIVLDQTQTG